MEVYGVKSFILLCTMCVSRHRLAAVGTQTEEHYEDHTSLTRQIKTLQQQLIDMQV